MLERETIPNWLQPFQRKCAFMLTFCVGILAIGAPAAALTIQIDGIEAAPGSDYTPVERLGLVSSKVGDALVKHVINIADCEGVMAAKSPIIRLRWSWSDRVQSLTSVPTPAYGIKVSAAGKSCSTTDMNELSTTVASDCFVVTANHAFGNSLTGSGEAVDINLAKLIGDTGCNTGSENTANVYFIVTTAGAGVGSTTFTGVVFNITLDFLAPAAPTITQLDSGDSNLRVAWSHLDTTASLSARVYWSEVAFSQASAWSLDNHSDTLTGTSYQITGLTNSQPYYVSVTALDVNGNESNGAPVKHATPIPVQDMWGYYKANGGAERGGYAPCSAGPHANSPWTLAIMVVLGLGVIVLRRRRPPMALPIALGLLFVCAAPRDALAVSPQTNSFEVRIGNYKPNIDSEFPKATPYADILNDSNWDTGIAIDWRLWHGFGELGMGFGASWWNKEGSSRSTIGTATADKTKLSIVPLTLDLVYRFDVLAERYSFPFVPYAKVGAVYGLWWITNGVGNITHYTGNDGVSLAAKGGTGGFHGSVGVRLLLDVFEPSAARSFDIEMGVNHSYLYAEYRVMSLNDFANPKSIDLSNDMLVFGLAFDL